MSASDLEFLCLAPCEPGPEDFWFIEPEAELDFEGDKDHEKD